LEAVKKGKYDFEGTFRDDINPFSFLNNRRRMEISIKGGKGLDSEDDDSGK